MMAASNIHYEIADRTRAIAPGGIGAIHLLARKIGLIHDIDEDLHLLKRHLPYHESDHVLNIAYNLLAGGSRLEHLEVRRNDEVYLDALGAERIPDPTTAGDFCRRFTEADVERLMDTFNETRLRVWKQQPDEFFDEAFIDADGTLAPTDGWCKQGVDIAYNGQWGYHPLVVSLANTAEPLFLVNRSGNRPSHERRRRLPGQGRRPVPPGGVPQDHLPGRHRLHPDQAPGPLGPATASASSSASTPCPTSRSLAEQLPDRGLQRAGAAAPVHDQDRAPPGPGAAQGADRRRAAVRHPEADRRGGGRVRVPAGRLREDVPGDRAPQEAGRSRRGRCGCSSRTATSSTSPTTGRPRRRRSCSWPTTGATRRT